MEGDVVRSHPLQEMRPAFRRRQRHPRMLPLLASSSHVRSVPRGHSYSNRRRRHVLIGRLDHRDHIDRHVLSGRPDLRDDIFGGTPPLPPTRLR